MNNNYLLVISISSTCFGRNYRPKHVELIEITNKLLLFILVCCLDFFSRVSGGQLLTYRQLLEDGGRLLLVGILILF